MRNKFYTCRYDIAFKEIFMNHKNKDILVALLESVLNIKIKELSYLNNEKIVDNINVKRKHFDLFIKTNLGKIQVEVNSGIRPYTRNRNAAYIFDTYCHETLIGEDYSNILLIVQINFTYGLGVDEKDFRLYKLMDDEHNEFVGNLLIYEYNMDYYNKIWYSNDKEKIDESKYIIMQDLKLEDLEELSKDDKVVEKYMGELERVNKLPEFREFMSAEEDNRKIENTMRNYAIKEGIKEGIKESAKAFIKNGVDLEIIKKSLNLSDEEIEEIKKDL